QETQAAAEGSDGGHPPPSSAGPGIAADAARAELTGTRIDPAGVPFIAGALVLAAAGGFAVQWALAIPVLVLASFFLYFFPDPDRVAVAIGDDAVLAPADGRVLVAGPTVAAAAPEGQWQQISIFLSPIDVHVNRVPVSGRVTHVAYKPGRFLPAYCAD